jgi:hypothetical protein
MLYVDGEEIMAGSIGFCAHSTAKKQGVPSFPSFGVRNFRTESQASKYVLGSM